MSQQQNKERLLVFTSDGDMRLDASAVKFHDTILSYRYGWAYPARPPTRRWSFRAEGRRPVSDGAMYVETTAPPDPGMDGEFLLKTIPSMWTAAYMGQNPRRWRLMSIPLSYVAMAITGALLAVTMVWHMATTGGEEPPPPAPPQPPPVEASWAPPKAGLAATSRLLRNNDAAMAAHADGLTSRALKAVPLAPISRAAGDNVQLPAPPAGVPAEGSVPWL